MQHHFTTYMIFCRLWLRILFFIDKTEPSISTARKQISQTTTRISHLHPGFCFCITYCDRWWTHQMPSTVLLLIFLPLSRFCVHRNRGATSSLLPAGAQLCHLPAPQTPRRLGGSLSSWCFRKVPLRWDSDFCVARQPTSYIANLRSTYVNDYVPTEMTAEGLKAGRE